MSRPGLGLQLNLVSIFAIVVDVENNEIASQENGRRISLKFPYGWLGLSPRKANSTLLPPGSFIVFLEDSTVTKTELICAKT
jgi:hypothetical protein